ncbi:MAG: siderophore-interacting protein [Ornithinimicrobium sp.]
MTRPTRPSTDLQVVSSHRVSPALVRVEFRSDDLSAFAKSYDTDRYVKLRLGGPGEREVLRTYTVLDPDLLEGTLAIEFVVHGDSGVAGAWAVRARPGDRLAVYGPGGAYAPSPEADWHLLAGDQTAIPAIRQSLAALLPAAVAEVVVEVDTPEHEVPLPLTSRTRVRWVHRCADGSLVEAVRSASWHRGRVHAFVHGEAGSVMHGIRPYLFGDRAVPRADVSISGYWRRGRAEEGFREWKAELAARESLPGATV